jgi:predicted permease
MKAAVSVGVPSLIISVVGALSEARLAICAAAAVFIVLIVALLILALRDIGPIFERGKTKFRLGPIRNRRYPSRRG